MAEVTITVHNFDKEVLESDKPVLLDFWATWCRPCRMLAPVIEEVANEHPEIKVGKVNIDEEPSLANLFNVSSIPMVVVIKNGKVVKKSVGFRPKKKIEAMLK